MLSLTCGTQGFWMRVEKRIQKERLGRGGGEEYQGPIYEYQVAGGGGGNDQLESLQRQRKWTKGIRKRLHF